MNQMNAAMEYRTNQLPEGKALDVSECSYRMRRMQVRCLAREQNNVFPHNLRLPVLNESPPIQTLRQATREWACGVGAEGVGEALFQGQNARGISKMLPRPDPRDPHGDRADRDQHDQAIQ